MALLPRALRAKTEILFEGERGGSGWNEWGRKIERKEDGEKKERGKGRENNEENGG